MDLSQLSDEELQRMLRQRTLASMSDDELESAIAARTSAAPQEAASERYVEPSWGDRFARSALRMVPGVSAFLPAEQADMAQFQQGVTLGWADELNAARDAAVAGLRGASWAPERNVASLVRGGGDGTSMTEVYDASMARQAEEREAFSRAHPVRAGAAELSGGVLGVGKVGAAAKAGQTFVRALPRLALAGSGSGAMAGAGTADSGDRIDGAVEGGIVGGIVGPVAAGVQNTLGAGYRLLRDQFRKTGVADEAVVAALQADGMTVDALRQAALKRPKGVPVSLADVGGDGVRSLLSGAAVKPGPAQRIVRETMERRLANQPERVKEAVAQAAGTREYALTLAQEVKQARWEKAAPLYQQAFADGPVKSARVLEILKDPDVSRAFGTATKIAEREGIALPPVYRMGTADKPDALTIERLPDVRTLDFVKRALDGEIDAGFRGGNTANAASLKKLRNELVGIMDKHSPSYREARAAYAGDSEVLEAIDLGGKALNMTDGQLAITLKGFRSDAEREAFRKSALDALNDRLNARDGTAVLNELISSDKKRRNLKRIVNDEAAYKKLTRQLFAERQIRETGRRVNPTVASPTAIRQGDAGALPDGVQTVQHLGSNSAIGLALQAAKALQRKGTGLTAEGGKHIATQLMAAGRKQQQQYLDQLTQAAKRLEQRARRRPQTWLGISGVAGATPGLLGPEGR